MNRPASDVNRDCDPLISIDRFDLTNVLSCGRHLINLTHASQVIRPGAIAARSISGVSESKGVMGGVAYQS